MTEPIFFLFTCVKDGRQYIEKLFDSLIKQTSTCFVHYIYEDGSVDPIEDLVNEYRKKVSKIKNPYKIIYEKQDKNIGLNLATKHCIENCYLPFFIWAGCDDWFDKNFFYEFKKTYIKNRKSIVIRSNVIWAWITDNGIDYRKKIGNYNDYHSKNQLYNIARVNYKTSAFAVNIETYKKINPNIYFDDNKYFFIDDQIMALCSFEPTFVYSKKAVFYGTGRTGSYSKTFVPSKNDIKQFYQNLFSKLAYPKEKVNIYSTIDYCDILFNKWINEPIFMKRFLLFKSWWQETKKAKIPINYKCPTYSLPFWIIHRGFRRKKWWNHYLNSHPLQ